MANPSDELRDLIDRAAQIQDMTQHPGWGLLVDYIRAQMGAKQQFLLLGNADDIEEYRKIAGWLQGVTAVLNAPDALNQQVEREQEKERETQGVSAQDGA